MTSEEILARVRQTVWAHEPTAKITLFGSRARGDAGPESDWDFLILLEGPVDVPRIDALRHQLYDLEVDIDEVISSVVFNADEWNSAKFRVTPLFKEVAREGVAV